MLIEPAVKRLTITNDALSTLTEEEMEVFTLVLLSPMFNHLQVEVSLHSQSPTTLQ